MVDFLQAHWMQIAVIYLAFAKFMTAIRDVVDATPGTDDNWFERTVTIINKLGGYLLLGQRPK